MKRRMIGFALASTLVALGCGTKEILPTHVADAGPTEVDGGGDAGGDAATASVGTSAHYVTMPDGTKLAVQVTLPPGPPGAKVPTVLRLTRYWRATEYKSEEAAKADVYEQLAGFYTSQGLAYVAVDARGTGASFGTSSGPWSPVEQDDAKHVLDWIVAQPWSSGKVGAIGTSYDGNSAVLLAATKHPALAAVVARFYDYDPFGGLAFPGGGYNAAYVDPWGAYTRALDGNDACALAPTKGATCDEYRAAIAGPLPVVRGDLAAALGAHAANLDLTAAMRTVQFRDDKLGAGASLEAVSPYQLASAIGASGTPLHVTASWLDSGTAAGALDGFATLKNPQTVVIGAFTHGGVGDNDPLAAPKPVANPPVEEQYVEAITFLAEKLAGAPPRESQIRYVTLGEGNWRTTTVWPPKSVATRALALGAGHALRDGVVPEADGQDDYIVDAAATSGKHNRWVTATDQSRADYGDRASQDARLLAYTSTPLAVDTRVTGTPVVHLRMSADTSDAMVFVYVEDVDAAGVSRYVTEGELRLRDRAVGGGPERVTGRTYRRGDARAYDPGTDVDLVIPLQPTSALLRAGHRVRIAIAGADADTFTPVTKAGARFTVRRGGANGSRLDLPVDSAP